MSIDFATLQGLTIPEGVVTQITDASGNVLWALANEPVILEVEKVTSNTYANGTKYTDEQFILLDIYPKTNGTVNVTYGGLTKTITDTSGATEPNAQQVFFGTFNGVTDSVETPASGTLTIDGDYYAFAAGQYAKTSLVFLSTRCDCVTTFISFGETERIPANAFYSCNKISEEVRFNKNIKQIGESAFMSCSALASVEISEGVESIGAGAFGSTSITSFHIPSSVTEITGHPFSNAFIGDNPITVDSKNIAYKIDGNCLIEIATGYLLAGFANSVIPSYVTRIGGSATQGGTFNGQTGLTSVTIPEGVQSIRGGAFSGCTGLTEMIFLPTTPPTLGNAAAVGGSSLTCPIIVPKGCGEAYKAAEYWSECASRIVEASA